MHEITLQLADEEAMSAFGARLATVTQGHGLIFLDGDLGMGKTTLSRGLIRGLGHTGSVKSPTFTLVMPTKLAIFAFFTLTCIAWSTLKSWSTWGFATISTKTPYA